MPRKNTKNKSGGWRSTISRFSASESAASAAGLAVVAGQTDGSPLDIQRGVDQFGRKFLKGSFTTDSPRRAIQTFYADLLNSHGYTIRTQSIPAWPPDRKAWLEGEHHSNGTTGPRFVIRIELTPAGETVPRRF